MLVAASLAGCSDTDCAYDGGLRLRVGGIVYSIPASADAVPHEAPAVTGLVRTTPSDRRYGKGQYCQQVGVSVIDTLRFSFRLSDRVADTGGHSSHMVTRSDAVARPFQPASPPISSSTITGVSPSALSVDRANRSATFDLRLRLAGGATRSVPVRCLWATGAPAGERNALMHCQMNLALSGGNVLDVVASPPGDDLDSIGSTLLRALRDAENFTRG